MKRYTEYHAGVAVIKDKTNMKEAMQRFAELEERATPKEPMRINEKMGIRYADVYRCPNCKRAFSGTGIWKYCYHCGQRFDWVDDRA